MTCASIEIREDLCLRSNVPNSGAAMAKVGRLRLSASKASRGFRVSRREPSDPDLWAKSLLNASKSAVNTETGY